MSLLVVLIILLISSFTPAIGQKKMRHIEKSVIVKTNLLSLFAQKPTISVEKSLNRRISGEFSFVQGTFKNVLFTDHYDYKGFLLRIKRYFVNIESGTLCPYSAVYTGTLARHIQSAGYTDNTGWFSWPSRDFKANSIRMGGSFGVSYMSKRNIFFDAQTSLGYGRYLHRTDATSKGYPDVQLWLCIGYGF